MGSCAGIMWGPSREQFLLMVNINCLKDRLYRKEMAESVRSDPTHQLDSATRSDSAFRIPFRLHNDRQASASDRVPRPSRSPNASAVDTGRDRDRARTACRESTVDLRPVEVRRRQHGVDVRLLQRQCRVVVEQAAVEPADLAGTHSKILYINDLHINIDNPWPPPTSSRHRSSLACRQP